MTDNDKDRDHGTLTCWTDRRSGFIRPDHGDRDVFVHHSAFESSEEPRQGDRVSFVLGADRRPGREAKICALRVRFEVGGGARCSRGTVA